MKNQMTANCKASGRVVALFSEQRDGNKTIACHIIQGLHPSKYPHIS